MIERHPESQAFHDALEAMGALHDRKQADYGTAVSPFQNVRMSEQFGMPAWIGCAVRMNDKMSRIQKASTSWIRDGDVAMANESLADSFLDLAVYAVIGLLLYEETLES